MPVIRSLSKVAKQALLSPPGCGCQPLTMAVRTISFSPRQITSDASFHSVSFSETDHPKVLITGMKHLLQAARCSEMYSPPTAAWKEGNKRRFISLYKLCSGGTLSTLVFLRDLAKKVEHSFHLKHKKSSAAECFLMALFSSGLNLHGNGCWRLLAAPHSLCPMSSHDSVSFSGGLGQLGVGLAKLLRSEISYGFCILQSFKLFSAGFSCMMRHSFLFTGNCIFLTLTSLQEEVWQE